ncbi:MAG: DUF3618 domain-containing protein [Actinobacteria bacterium]|nr:DUF3618 domain-containing protein [Actinomycetota bacterium]
MPERTAQDIQREIEQSRDALAASIDQLVERASPKRIGSDLKVALLVKAQSPAGKAVIGGVGALVVLLIVRRVRRARSVD